MSEKRKTSTSTPKRRRTTKARSKAAPASEETKAAKTSEEKQPETAQASKAPAVAADGAEKGTSESAPHSSASEGVQPVRETSDIYGFADLLQAEQDAADDEQRQVERAESWVSFRLSDQTCALPVEQVQEVLRVGSITRVPHTPHSVRGVTNLRGRVLPVVDLRCRLGLEEADLDEHSRVLVATFANRPIGMLVDGVDQMVAIQPSTIQDTPEDAEQLQDDVIHGVCSTEDRGLLLLLDLQRLLTLPTETEEAGVH